MRYLRYLLYLMLLLGIAISSSVSAQDSGPIYIVQSGDSLYSIAQRFGTTIEELATVNNIIDPSIIGPGFKMIIPGFNDVSGELELKEVGFGENLFSISQYYGIGIHSLARLNRILHPGRLYIGQFVILSTNEEDPNSFLVELSRPGESRLEYAARNALNPWALENIEGVLNRSWIYPGESLIMFTDEGSRHFLPAPIRAVEIKPLRVLQGQTLSVRIEQDDPASISGAIGEWDLHFNQLQSQDSVALQGIHAMAEPGLYDLRIEWTEQSNEEMRFNFSQPLRVASGDYWFDPVLYVPPETIETRFTQPENELIASIVGQNSDLRYWDGVFDFPSLNTASFPSYFGVRRNYNDTGYTTYHSGLDLFGGMGMAITAPAKGKVVFTGSLDVRGNATFVDHGWGIISGYLHQAEINVSVGDVVEKGEIIGLVGNSGRVTGPHLHWEIWVGGVPVDPLQWTSIVFP